eukprot:gene29728-35893_t
MILQHQEPAGVDYEEALILALVNVLGGATFNISGTGVTFHFRSRRQLMLDARKRLSDNNNPQNICWAFSYGSWSCGARTPAERFVEKVKTSMLTNLSPQVRAMTTISFTSLKNEDSL